MGINLQPLLELYNERIIMTTLNTSINRNSPNPNSGKSILSSVSTVTPEQAQKLLNLVSPVTLPYTDPQGKVIQLWNYKSQLVASVDAGDKVIIIPGNCISNPLNPKEESHYLLKRLEEGGLKEWRFNYCDKTGKIVIWPHIVAAGKDGPTGWKPPVFLETPDSLGHIFKEDNGHLAKDTPQNRAYISQAVSHPSNKVATDNFGNDIYVKTFSDGSQAWAVVRGNEIRDGGRNEPPRKWVQGHPKHGGQLEEYFSMLNVINFFSSYFMTLKAHDTIPYFPRMTLLSLFLKSDQSCHLFPIIDVAA